MMVPTGELSYDGLDYNITAVYDEMHNIVECLNNLYMSAFVD